MGWKSEWERVMELEFRKSGLSGLIGTEGWGSGHTAPMGWQDRLDVAIKVAETLASLLTSSEGLVYYDLNPYRVLFDKNLHPALSCFGLIKAEGDGASHSVNFANPPPEFFRTGIADVTPESTVYSYGILLQTIVGGRCIRPNQFLELAQDPDNVAMMVDSSLLGGAGKGDGKEEAMELVPLVANCLNPAPNQRPTMQAVLGVLSDMAARPQVGGGMPRLHVNF